MFHSEARRADHPTALLRITRIDYPGGAFNTFKYNGLGLRSQKGDSAGTFNYVCDGISPAAVDRLQESVGVDAQVRELFAARLEGLQPDAAPGAVLLGLLLGLSTAQLAVDRR